MSTSNTLPDFELLHPQSTEQALRMLAAHPRPVALGAQWTRGAGLSRPSSRPRATG